MKKEFVRKVIGKLLEKAESGKIAFNARMYGKQHPTNTDHVEGSILGERLRCLREVKEKLGLK